MPKPLVEMPLHKSLTEIKDRFPEHGPVISKLVTRGKPKTAGQLLRMMEKEIPGFKTPEEWVGPTKSKVELPDWLRKAAPVEHHGAIAEELAKIKEEGEVARPGKLREKLISRLEARGVSLSEKALVKLSPAKLFSMLEGEHQKRIREHLLRLLRVPEEKWGYYTNISQLDKDASRISSEPTAIRIEDDRAAFSGQMEQVGAEVEGLARGLEEFQRDAFVGALAAWIKENGIDELEEEELLKRRGEITRKAGELAEYYKEAEAMTPKQYLAAAKKIKNQILKRYDLNERAVGTIGRMWNENRKRELEEMRRMGVRTIIFTPAKREELERRAHSLAVTHITTKQVIAALQKRIGKSIHPAMFDRIQEEMEAHTLPRIMERVGAGEFGRLSDEEVAEIADGIARKLYQK